MEAKLLQELKEHYSQESVKQHAKLIDLADGGIEIVHYVQSDRKDANDGEASIVHFISTPRIDPVMDVMNPFGMNDQRLSKNKSVFYNHSWYGSNDLPIGKSLWRKKQRDGVLAKTQYAVNEYSFARDVYNLVKGDFLNSYSIGFMPTDWSIVSIAQLKQLVNGEFDIQNIGDFGEEDKVWLHNAWGCYEYSQVGVPMNEDAVKKIAKALEGGLIVSDFGKNFFGSIVGREKVLTPVVDNKMSQEEVDALSHEKSLCPYHEYPLADKDVEWDAAEQVKNATVDDLKKMCTWYDSDNQDVKSSYKLPHHMLDGYKTVWRGVANAAARLPQADIPEEDVAGVKSHLGKHYKEFGEVAPWDKSAEMWDEYSKLVRIEAIKPGESSRLGELCKEFGFDEKSGAVLSAKNKQALNEAKSKIDEVLASAESGENSFKTNADIFGLLEGLAQNIEEIQSKIEKIQSEKISEKQTPEPTRREIVVNGASYVGAAVDGAISSIRGKVN